VAETNSLHPVDVLVACKLFSKEEDKREWTYAATSKELDISQATLHASVTRCIRAQLLTTTGMKIHRRRFLDLLTVAVPIVFYPERGGLTNGTLTAVVKGDEVQRIPYVWAGPGETRGVAISPVYPTVPSAAALDPRLREILCLVDVLRLGHSPSESSRATNALTRKIVGKDSVSP
jgi:hypothetical protein